MRARPIIRYTACARRIYFLNRLKKHEQSIVDGHAHTMQGNSNEFLCENWIQLINFITHIRIFAANEVTPMVPKNVFLRNTIFHLSNDVFLSFAPFLNHKKQFLCKKTKKISDYIENMYKLLINDQKISNFLLFFPLGPPNIAQWSWSVFYMYLWYQGMFWGIISHIPPYIFGPGHVGPEKRHVFWQFCQLWSLLVLPSVA